MSWDEKDSKETVSKEATQPKVEPKAEAVEPAKAESSAPLETPKDSQPVTQAAESTKALETVTTEPMVHQKMIGKVAKELREKRRQALAEQEERIKALEDENRRLRDGQNGSRYEEPDPRDIEEDTRIATKVREEFLRRNDVYGRKRYGADYDDALQLVKSQNDPALVSKIQGALNPADTLMEEAMRIAQEIEWGADPSERERKKQAALREQIRKELESEMAEKIKARSNQPTDVQNVRAAGSDNQVRPRIDDWSTTLPK